ncbi:hypothetical protein Dsin_002046 [Dipteronia sinensis]|uniref:Uncharacterized protein n=1 Tax=Dipteronia sinensis TaxID=43782 RepID=A0AAE0B6H8_9ROSI|nr:hypothetical protein Dsin_002046 [Dipteronia sinensis]
MDDETFLKELSKIFSEIQEILKPKWRSSTDPEGSANKVFSSSNLESAKQYFPKFEGSDQKLWIRKCDRAFLLHPVPQDHKVLVASSQFETESQGMVSTYLC